MKALKQKFLALQHRERVLILIAGLAVPLFIGFLLFIEPAWKQAAKFDQDLRAAQTQLNDLQTQINLTQRQLSTDPNQPYQQRLTELKTELARIDQQVSGHTTELVLARQMPSMLRELLGATDRVKLVSLRSLQPVKIDVDAQAQSGENSIEQAEPTQMASDSTDKITLYQHGVALQLQGSYFDIQAYLKKVRELNWRIYWHKFDYQTDTYPQAVVSLELYTISTSRSFMGL